MNVLSAMAHKEQKCDICQTQNAKYRCAQCPSVRYCSVFCFKEHYGKERGHRRRKALLGLNSHPSEDNDLYSSHEEDEFALSTKLEGSDNAPSDSKVPQTGIWSTPNPRKDEIRSSPLDSLDLKLGPLSDMGSSEDKKRVYDDPSPVDREQGEGPVGKGPYDDSRIVEGILTPRQLYALSTDEKICNFLTTPELQTLITKIDSSRSRLDALETAEYNIPEFASFTQHVADLIFMYS